MEAGSRSASSGGPIRASPLAGRTAAGAGPVARPGEAGACRIRDIRYNGAHLNIRLGRAAPAPSPGGLALGKPFASELDAVADTYEWAASADVTHLADAIASIGTSPLVAIGSGGSLTAADFAARLHESYTGAVSVASTPMGVAGSQALRRGAAGLLVSAGGRNPDVLNAARWMIRREARALVVLCGDKASPLASLAAKYPWTEFVPFSLPSRKDGFLATNSLVAFITLLGRAYASAFGRDRPNPFPQTWADLVANRAPQPTCNRVTSRRYLLGLFGPSLRCAALDLESKCSEAGLAGVQLADYRNFAHGRHHWIATQGDDTAIIAFISDADRDVALRTLKCIPRDVPVAIVDVGACDATAQLLAVTRVFGIVQALGTSRGIDPGRPHVPEYGRRLYNLRIPSLAPDLRDSAASRVDCALARKKRVYAGGAAKTHPDDVWQTALANFVGRMESTSFRAVALDYDGTICSRRDRLRGIPPRIASELQRLLDGGIRLGIATGRGKSVAAALRESLNKRTWSRVLVGYYNGGAVVPLNEDLPADVLVPSSFTSDLSTRLVQAGIGRIAEIETRHPQVMIRAFTPALAEAAFLIAQDVVAAAGIPGAVVARSSHSLDVLAPGVSKRSLVAKLSPDATALCIGDAGLWPGNDAIFLHGPASLSVDEVSPDPHSCWNLCAPGVRGPDGTLQYLSSMSVRDGVAHWRWAGRRRAS